MKFILKATFDKIKIEGAFKTMTPLPGEIEINETCGSEAHENRIKENYKNKYRIAYNLTHSDNLKIDEITINLHYKEL